jgi:hypothetical protein
MQILPKINLSEFQSLDVFPQKTRPPDTYILPLQVEGNAVLSTLRVVAMDPGSQIAVRYFELTTGELGLERSNKASHRVVTPGLLLPVIGLDDQITVTPIHNKPVCEIVITGGNVEFSLYATVVNSFATDLDAALKREGDPVLSTSKGIPIMVQTASGFAFLEADPSGNLVLTLSQGTQAPTHGFGTVQDDGDTLEVTTYEVPVSSVFLLSAALVSSFACGVAYLYVNGVIKGTSRTMSGSPNGQIQFSPPLEVSATQEIKIVFECLEDLGIPILVDGTITGGLKGV